MSKTLRIGHHPSGLYEDIEWSGGSSYESSVYTAGEYLASLAKKLDTTVDPLIGGVDLEFLLGCPVDLGTSVSIYNAAKKIEQDTKEVI